MEEKILIKGTFGGKFIPFIFYIIGVVPFVILTIYDVADSWDGILITLGAGILLLFGGLGLIMSVIIKKRELIITNKRIIVRSAFGFRTDFPIEKVTDISMRPFSGIGCGSPSLKIMFHFCKNKQEIFDTIASETLKRDSAFLQK